MSTGVTNRKQLAKGMREFTLDKLNLTLVPDESENPNADKFPTLYAPKWLRFSSGILGALLFFSSFFVLGRRRSSSYSYEPDSEPFIWIHNNQGLAWSLWGVLLVITIYVFVVRSRYTDRRLNMLASINKLTPYKRGAPHMPGGITKNAFGYVQAFKAPEPIDAVSFGVVSGWWDPNTKPKYNPGRSGNLKNQLFVQVALPELTGETVIVNKNRDWTRDELPKMSDKAYKAVSTLATWYSVVIGEGQILIALAGKTENGFSMSLEGDLESMMGWKICIDFINNELADIVEGLA